MGEDQITEIASCITLYFGTAV